MQLGGGMAAPRARPALLLVDVVNALDFEGSEALVAAAERAAPRIRALAVRARAERVPVVYANDNFGQWRSDFRSTIEACTAPDKPGREVSHLLKPEPCDYFVLKPQHSAFFATPLDLLLRHLGIGSLVIAGFATDFCVLFTAHEAYMRRYHLYVPEDCTASNSEAITARTLAHLREALGVSTAPSSAVDFRALARDEAPAEPAV